MGCKIKPVNPKENQLRIFIGRTDANLKLQYFGYLMQRSDSLEKTLMLVNTEGRRRRGRQRMRWLDGITNSVNSWRFQEMVKVKEAWCTVVHEVAKSQTQLSD